MRSATDTSLIAPTIAPMIAYLRADPWQRPTWPWNLAGRHDDRPARTANTRSRSTSRTAPSG